MPTAKLDARNVHSLPALQGARTDYRDTLLTGLFLRVSPTGHRSFGLVYRNSAGKLRRLTIGTTPPVSLATAREIARQRLAEIVKGADPQGEKVAGRRAARVTALSFGEVCDQFVADQADDWRPSTRKGWTRYIEKEIKPALGSLRPEDVSPTAVRALVDRIRLGDASGKNKDGTPKWIRKPAPVSARRCYEVIRRLSVWAVWRGYLPVSPCDQAKPFERKKSGKKKASKNKPYSDQQLRAIFSAIKGTELEILAALIALTGVRSHEARSARWDDLDLERKLWRVPADMHKTGDETGTPHLVPLTKGALRLISDIREASLAAGQRDSPWLFPAPTAACEVCGHTGHADKPNKATAAVKAAAGIADRGLLHRFRDTLKTRLSEHGVPDRVSEHLLGHVVPGIAGVYDHAEMLPHRREALEWWNDELGRILRPAKRGKLVRIRA